MFNRVTQLGATMGRQVGMQTMQSDIATLTNEISSGKKANLAQSMGVGVAVLYKLYDDVQQGGAMKSAVTFAGQQLGTMQSALGSINTTLGNLMTNGLQALTDGSAGSTALLASQARQTMSTVTSLMNTQLGGQHLFGGADSGGAPMAPSDAPGGPLATMRAMVSGPVDASNVDQLLANVDAVFNGGGSSGSASYNGLFYQSASTSSDPATQVHIGAGQTLSYNLRGDSQGFKDSMQAMSLLSLLDAKDPATGQDMLNADAKTALRAKASGLLGSAQDKLTAAAGMLGVTQQRLQSVADIQDRAVTAATTQINTLESVDYYTATAQLNSLKTQLQASYSLTSSLSGLSLVNYLG